MGAEKKFDKSKLPSRHTTVGPERAPHRSYLHAMGLGDDEIARPLIGVATTWNEAAPCNISLSRQAQVVKRGVELAQGTPREPPATARLEQDDARGAQPGVLRVHRARRPAQGVFFPPELFMRGFC